MATRLTRSTTTPTLSTKCTFSAWVKRSDSAIDSSGRDAVLCENYIDGNNYAWIRFDGSDKLNVYGVISNSAFVSISTNRVFRDPSAWYHIVCVLDSTESTSSDRLKIYVNGERETSLSGSTYPGSSDNIGFNRSGGTFILGDSLKYTSNFQFDGQYSHVHFVDGAAHQASTFGSTDATTGEWDINTSPTIAEYGANGFFMFKDDASLNDDSGKGNNFTVAAGSIQKTEDCPSNNFAAFNPLFRHGQTTSDSKDFFDNANTTFYTPSNNDARKGFFVSTLGMSSGKYYCEIKVRTGGRLFVGICNMNVLKSTSVPYDLTNQSFIGYYALDGNIKYDNDSTYATSVAAVNNDILGFALDMDNSHWYIHKNGTYINSGDPTSGSTGTGSIIGNITSGSSYFNHGEMFFMAADFSTSGYARAEFNFGNGFFASTAISSEGTNASGIGKFEYDVPNGYSALSTKGLNE